MSVIVWRVWQSSGFERTTSDLSGRPLVLAVVVSLPRGKACSFVAIVGREQRADR